MGRAEKFIARRLLALIFGTCCRREADRDPSIKLCTSGGEGVSKGDQVLKHKGIAQRRLVAGKGGI